MQTGSLGGEARAFFSLGLVVMIGFIAFVGRGVVIPLIVAIFLSFLIHTLKQTIKGGPLVGRFLPDWLCFAFAFALIGSVGLFIIDIVRDNVEALATAAPLYEERLRALSRDAVAVIREQNALPEDFMGGVEALRQQALDMIRPLLAGVGAALRSLTGNIVTVLLYTIFMLLERGRIFRKIDLVCTDGAQLSAVNGAIDDVGRLVRDYITVKTVSNLIVAGGSYAVMRVVGVDFAGFWALLIFLFNFIPIVGAITAIMGPVLLSLVQPDGGVQRALLVLVLLEGVDQLMSSVIEPRLIGKSLNLSPLAILLSLAVWGALWGFAGMLLAVPITVTLMIILAQYEATRPVAIMLSDNGQIASRTAAAA
jgi:predicted PurR-regulated permease PerM